MKKALLALASFAACGGVLAQSSVTIFGLVDARLAVGKGSVSDRTQIATSGNGANRLGFRGVEDLGGGLNAGFWLEMGLAPDSGLGQPTNINNQASGTGNAPAGTQGLTFNRRSTVSLSGSLGELRVGRDVTPILWSQSVFDPFSYLSVGITQIATNIGGPTGVRASNSIGYFTPANLGGFYGQFMHFRGENPSGTATSKDGNGSGVRAGYAAGPVDLALAWQRTDFAAGNIESANLGGTYDFGAFKATMLLHRDEVVGVRTGKGWMLGARVPVGPGEFKASLSSYKGTLASADRQTDKIAVGYVYNLSKRTAVYAHYARLNNKNGATEALNGGITGANQHSSGFDLGLRHSF